MALSLDDKLLGEKVDNYCSSSEDEGDGNDSDGDCKGNAYTSQATFIPDRKPETEYSGRSANTGPKGVINDWREFKRLETEQREEQELERKKMMEKLQMSCRLVLSYMKLLCCKIKLENSLNI